MTDKTLVETPEPEDDSRIQRVVFANGKAEVTFASGDTDTLEMSTYQAGIANGLLNVDDAEIIDTRFPEPQEKIVADTQESAEVRVIPVKVADVQPVRFRFDNEQFSWIIVFLVGLGVTLAYDPILALVALIVVGGIACWLKIFPNWFGFRK